MDLANTHAFLRALAFFTGDELDPDYPIAMFDLGGAYWNLGEHDKALKTWADASERFPNDAQIDKVLAFLGQ